MNLDRSCLSPKSLAVDNKKLSKEGASPKVRFTLGSRLFGLRKPKPPGKTNSNEPPEKHLSHSAEGLKLPLPPSQSRNVSPDAQAESLPLNVKRLKHGRVELSSEDDCVFLDSQNSPFIAKSFAAPNKRGAPSSLFKKAKLK